MDAAAEAYADAAADSAHPAGAAARREESRHGAGSTSVPCEGAARDLSPRRECTRLGHPWHDTRPRCARVI